MIMYKFIYTQIFGGSNGSHFDSHHFHAVHVTAQHLGPRTLQVEAAHEGHIGLNSMDLRRTKTDGFDGTA